MKKANRTKANNLIETSSQGAIRKCIKEKKSYLRRYSCRSISVFASVLLKQQMSDRQNPSHHSPD